MTESKSPPTPIDAVRAAKVQFVAFVAPYRPDLYCYARALTRSPWDAEDLVQETLARAFARMGDQRQTPEEPRAYLLRMASNAWIDRQRRARREAALVVEETADAKAAAQASPNPRDVRESLATLATALAPQERAAIVLKDVFDMSLEETADLLGTTPNAVKAALHRGRERLTEADATPRKAPSPRVIDAFVAAFNARDTKALASMLLTHATTDVVGFVVEHGRDEILSGSIHFTLEVDDDNPRAEPRVFAGETIALVWTTVEGREAVDSFVRFQTAKDDGGTEKVAAIEWFYFCPEVIREVGEALGVPVKTSGYQR